MTETVPGGYRTPEARDRHLEQKRAWIVAERARQKAAVIAAYGGKCTCCGETEPVFLCVDHVADDGAAHREAIGYGRTTDGRRRVGSGSIIIAWLVRNNFPPGFQILCASCNLAKQSGVCPHQRQR